MSPEFQRNLWLEATPFRLALIAGFLLLAFLAVGVSQGQVATLSTVATGLYWFFAILWGTRSAALSVVGEIRERTWDSQKLSSIGPTEMVWGKLFGATIHCWFGALICLPAILWPLWQEDMRAALLQGLVLLLLGLLAQTVALLSSLLVIRRNTGNWRLDIFLCQVAGVVAAFVFNKAWDVTHFMSTHHYAGLPSQKILSWWGYEVSQTAFSLASLLLFASWSLVGCWRAMRAELRFTNGPFVWLAWLAYIAIYQAGFEHLLGTGISMSGQDVQIDAVGHVALKLMLAGFAILASAYGMAFLEPKDPVRLRWLGEQLGAGERVRAFLALDAWMLSYGAAMLVGAAAALLLSFSVGAFSDIAFRSLAPAVLAMLGFLTRDVAIFVLAGRVGRGKGDFAAIAMLAALYLLLPIILKPVAPALVSLFVPTPASLLSPVSAWIQGLVLAGLALRSVDRSVNGD
jgi:hypothetical protein